MGFGSFKVKFFIALSVIFTTVSSVLAEENVISSVTISKAKDKKSGYELSVDSTQAVHYKSHIDSNGNVYFDLKNSIVAQNLGTVYDDVSNINNVSVKQLDKNKVRIYISGKEARNTDLIFVNSMFETKKDTPKNVVINRPINEYKSTTYRSHDLADQEEIQDWDDNSFNFTYLLAAMFSELKDGSMGKILILLFGFVALLIAVKTFAKKMMQDREQLFGENNPDILNEEIKIGTSTAKKTVIAKEPLPVNNARNEALKMAQMELAKAHQKYQQYIQNKYQGQQKPKSVDVDTLKKSIALNQYQKSTQNPYKNQEVVKMNKVFMSDISQNSNISQNSKYQIPPRPKMEKKPEFTSPYIQRKTNVIKQNPAQNPLQSQVQSLLQNPLQNQIKSSLQNNTRNSNVEPSKTNMKFLESVTKIYEQSGRKDLAVELKNSISKAKQTI